MPSKTSERQPGSPRAATPTTICDSLATLSEKAKGSQLNPDVFVASQFDPKGLDNIDEKAFLTVCQFIYREHRDYTTPFQTFVITLIMFAQRHAMDLTTVRGVYEEFVRNWEDCVETSTTYSRDYPDFAEKLVDETAAAYLTAR